MESLHNSSPTEPMERHSSTVRANPIRIQNEISAYMHWSLPLSIVLSADHLREWFLERFIHIYAMYHDNPGYDPNYLWVDFYEYKQIFRNPVLFTHEASLCFDDLEYTDIVGYMIKKASLGYYLMVFLDEYYLPGKRAYQNRHFVHPSLFFGYDEAEKKFLSLGFDQSNILAKMELSFDQVKEGFRSAKSHYRTDAAYAEHEIVQFFLPNPASTPCPINYRRILQQLKEYLDSKNDAEKDYVLFQGNDKANKQKPYCGLSVYDHVIKGLERYLEGRHAIDYRAVHVLYEHKRAILTRLDYILAQLASPPNLARLIDEYKPLVTEMDQARMVYMKCALKASNFRSFYKLPADKGAIETINATLRSVKEKESRLLTEIYGELEPILSR